MALTRDMVGTLLGNPRISWGDLGSAPHWRTETCVFLTYTMMTRAKLSILRGGVADLPICLTKNQLHFPLYIHGKEKAGKCSVFGMQRVLMRISVLFVRGLGENDFLCLAISHYQRELSHSTGILTEVLKNNHVLLPW